MKYMIPALASLMVLSACDLSLMPETSYSEGNVEVSEETESQYNTREDIKGLRDNLYNSYTKNNTLQEGIFLD